MTDDGKNSLTPITKRIVEAGAEIALDTPDRIDFLHKVLCQLGLPRSKINKTEFIRTSGQVSIKIESGTLWDGKEHVSQPLPYGPTPRLALIHVSSEAVKRRDRTIDVGDSMKDFLDMLGIGMSGPRWRSVRNQMQALAASKLTIGMATNEHATTINTVPISRFDAWLSHEGGQRTLWPGSLTLSQDFYDTLIEYAVPLDGRAIAALQHSSLALDTYTWLAHRLCRIKKDEGVKLSWANLREQFGQEYRSPKNFKREMKASLLAASAVYPDARIEDEAGGIRLRPSPPPIRRVAVQVDNRLFP